MHWICSKQNGEQFVQAVISSDSAVIPAWNRDNSLHLGFSRVSNGLFVNTVTVISVCIEIISTNNFIGFGYLKITISTANPSVLITKQCGNFVDIMEYRQLPPGLL